MLKPLFMAQLMKDSARHTGGGRVVRRGCIADEDWRVTELETAFAVTRQTQADEGMRYFEQAEIDREVFVFTHSHWERRMMAR